MTVLPKITNTYRALKLVCLSVCLSAGVMAQGDTTRTDYVSTLAEFSIDCLTPPEGFVKPEGFNGYVHWSTKSSMLITLVQNRTIVDAQESLNDEYYRANGVTFVSKKEVVTDHGEKGYLYKFTYETSDMKWYRYALFLGNLNGVLWVNASYPAKYEEVVEKEMLKSLMTTKFMEK